ncbi:MAG: hypothetical protein ACSHXL_02415 [Bacteroidota bacterium]
MQKINKIELSFACDEDWNKMTQAEKGRHCAMCKKTVVDFSNYSNKELVSFYNQPKNATTCGRFKVGQLENLNYNIANPIQESKPRTLRPIFASVLLTAAACSSNPGNPQKGTKSVIFNDRSTTEYSYNSVNAQVDKPQISEEIEDKKRNVIKKQNVKSTLKDTARNLTQELPVVTVVRRARDSQSKLMRLEEHTAGVPMLHYELQVEKVPLHKRIFYRIKSIFKRNK